MLYESYWLILIIDYFKNLSTLYPMILNVCSSIGSTRDSFILIRTTVSFEVYDATIHIEQGEATVTWNEAPRVGHFQTYTGRFLSVCFRLRIACWWAFPFLKNWILIQTLFVPGSIHHWHSWSRTNCGLPCMTFAAVGLDKRDKSLTHCSWVWMIWSFWLPSVAFFNFCRLPGESRCKICNNSYSKQ